jgi:SanA protein
MNAVSLNTGWLRANRSRLIAAALAMLMASAAVVVIADRVCQRASRGRIFRSIDSMPAQDVALVLGTSKTTRAGNPNLHFKHRMDAAVALYRAGKVKHLLVSGDNHIESYDEATDMRDALVSAGVPVGAITCDYAGFRTLDSVMRAQSVFGLTNFAIVTEEFHSPRAVWIARRHRLDVVAFAAPDVPLASWSVRAKTREYLARVLCAADLYVLNRRPKFPGPPEPILLSSQAQ